VEAGIEVEYRQLGRSGLRVSTLALGTATFGGAGIFGTLGSTDVAAAKQQIDMCLDAGVNLFDTANMYSYGLSEEIVGKAIEGRRDKLLLSTKVRMPMGEGPMTPGCPATTSSIRPRPASAGSAPTASTFITCTNGTG
jgi:aryl-alcohol dehydrogenase-like predicted oxidoreductase